MTSTIPAVDNRPADGSALQAVLLDMDGTLVDTEGFWWDAEVEVFAEMGHYLDEAHREVVVGGPMTRSLGHLISVTGTNATLAELSALINRRFTQLIGRGVPLMPGARPAADRTRCPRGAHGAGLRLAPAHHRLRTALARPGELRPVDRGRRGRQDQAAPRALPRRGRPPRRRPGPLRRHRGRPDRRYRGRGGRLPGGGRAVHRAHRIGTGQERCSIPGTHRSDFSALSDYGRALSVYSEYVPVSDSHHFKGRRQAVH